MTIEANKSSNNEFESLVTAVKRELRTISGLNAAEIDTASLLDLFRGYHSRTTQWERYAFADPDLQYTRNGVCAIENKADLLILVWTPGKSSAVHDHAQAHCIMKVLQGGLRETLYDIPESRSSESERSNMLDKTNDPVAESTLEELRVRKITDLKTNDVAYISDQVGLHKITNEGSEPAVSLHLYTPPWASKFGCNVYDDHGRHRVEVSGLYSVNGVKI